MLIFFTKVNGAKSLRVDSREEKGNQKTIHSFLGKRRCIPLVIFAQQPLNQVIRTIHFFQRSQILREK
jgi:hypothetical protein